MRDENCGGGGGGKEITMIMLFSCGGRMWKGGDIGEIEISEPDYHTYIMRCEGGLVFFFISVLFCLFHACIEIFFSQKQKWK